MTDIIILINSFIQNLIKIVFRTLSVSLAKVEVEGSNPFARSNRSQIPRVNN